MAIGVLKRVVTEPAFAREHGLVFYHSQPYGLGERIIMPLAADGIHGDGNFGATVYATNRFAPTPQDETTARYQDATQTDFFAPH